MRAARSSGSPRSCVSWPSSRRADDALGRLLGDPGRHPFHVGSVIAAAVDCSCSPGPACSCPQRREARASRQPRQGVWLGDVRPRPPGRRRPRC
jgi:hypothetical protein